MKKLALLRLPLAPLFVLMVLAVTLAVYSPGLQGDYALDDYTNIVDNEALALQQLSLADLSRAAFSFQAGPTMRPISMISFALNRYFYGPEAYSFKLTNLVIHLLNGLLVFLLLTQLLTCYRRRYAPQIDPRRLQWAGLLVGAMWLLHPLNFLPVMYVVQRETSLSASFALLGVNLYLWARERQLAGRSGTLYIWVGVPLLTLLATLCKESGALLPLYALTVEFFIFRFRDASNGFSRPTAAFYLVFLLLPGIAGLFLMVTARGGAFLNYGNRDFSMLERLMSEARVVWLYIRWTWLPDQSSLGLYHDDIAVSRGLLQPATTLFSIVGIAALLAICWWCRRVRPLVALGIAWFLCGQLLESTIFPLELAYEHRNYLPDLGLLLALVAFVRPEAAANRAVGIGKQGLLLLLLLLFAWVTLQRALSWRDNLTFAQAEARNHPQSPYATYMLGQTYANLALFGDRSHYDDAVQALNTASDVPGSSVITDVSLILVESQLAKHVEPGVFDRIERKLSTQRINASDLQALDALVDCVDKYNCELPAADIHAVFGAALSNPYLGKMVGARANILVIYGNFISARPQPDLAEARGLMAQAAALVPHEPQYRANLVTMDISMRDAAQARKDLDELRKLNYLGHLDGEIAAYAAQIQRLDATGAGSGR